jgi:hypothetical protein
MGGIETHEECEAPNAEVVAVWDEAHMGEIMLSRDAPEFGGGGN